MSVNDETTPSTHQLTSDEVHLIQETWKIPNGDAHNSAELIFYTFLERFPEHQQMFKAFKNKPLDDLKGKPYFRAHASRIFNVFSSVVDCLAEDPENKEIKKFIAEVGVFHAKKKVTKKAYNELRVVLVEILSDVCKLDDNGKIAWSKLLDIFFNVMFECVDGRSEQFM